MTDNKKFCNLYTKTPAKASRKRKKGTKEQEQIHYIQHRRRNPYRSITDLSHNDL